MAKVKCEPAFTQFDKVNVREPRKLTVDGAEVETINPDHFTAPIQASYDSSNSFSMTGNQTEDFQIGRRVQLDSGQSDLTCNKPIFDLTPDDVFTANKYDYSIITGVSFDGAITDVTIADNIATPKLEEASIDINWVDSQAGLITTTDLINSSRGYPSNFTLETSGFTTSGDGGGAKWKQNGVIAQTPSQTPAQLGDALLNDASGNQWRALNYELYPESLGAIGDSITNDSDPMQAVLNSGRDLVLPNTFKKYKIEKQIVVPAGLSIRSENTMGGVFLNNDSSIIDEAQSVIYVDFGAGIDDSVLSVYYDNAAVLLNSGSGVVGVSFWYPSQNLNSNGPPTAYPPTITSVEDIRGALIEYVNIGNSYIGIDISRDSGGVIIKNIAGFPLYKGVIHGSAINPIDIETVTFTARRVLRGNPWISPNIASWVMENGTGIELRRTTWANYDKIFMFGYSVGISLVNGLASPSDGINIGGSPQNININQCGFDTCVIGVGGFGFIGRVNILSCNFAPNVLYGITPSKSLAIDIEADPGATVTGVTIKDCNVWATYSDAINIKNQDYSIISSNKVYKVGGDAQGVGIHLDNCKFSSVNNNILNSGGTLNSNKGIYLSNNCEGTIVTENNITDFDNYPLQIDSTDYANISNNIGLNNTNEIVVDTSTTKKYQNKISNNKDDLTNNYSNSDVSATILNFRISNNIINYSGTTAISGITHGRVGQQIVIRFSAVCTLTDQDGAINQENRLYLSSNFTTSFGDTITLISNGNLGWYEQSRSVN